MQGISQTGILDGPCEGMGRTYLYAGFRQGSLRGEPLPRGHAGVVALLELLLELLQLVRAEGRSVSSEFRLLRAVQAAGIVLAVDVQQPGPGRGA